jgi:putative transport protein
LSADSTGVLTLFLENPLLVLFATITLGLLVGQVRIAGVSLGSSGVIFVALAMGHLGARLPDEVGKIGLVLFVYCVGITAGPSFFRVFVRHGRQIGQLTVALVLVAAGSAWLLARTLSIPADLTAGLFAGSLTSTPALAAAMERLPQGSQVAVSYGLAYPFGVVAVVVFVQLVPRLLRVDLNALSRSLAARDAENREIVRVLVEVVNPAVTGQRLADLPFIAESNCQVSRQLKGNRLVPVTADFQLEAGQHVLLVGRQFRVDRVLPLLGHRSDKTDFVMDTEHERSQVIVTSKEVVGRSLRDLRLLASFGVTVSRITRYDLEFVPDLDDVVEYGDALSVVGEPANLQRFAEHAGHRARAFDETDIISLGLGVIVGVLLGLVEFRLGGQTLKLGLAGGPLLVGLLLGHLGHLGRLRGHLPRASRLLLQEIGLVFFLAAAGLEAGAGIVEVVRGRGLELCLVAIVIAFVPMVAGALAARYVFKMNLLQSLGAVCGGMTSTPALGVITSSVDSEIPVISYAASYPVALILATVMAPALVASLR